MLPESISLTPQRALFGWGAPPAAPPDAPETWFFSLVRTNAAPLPGFTCKCSAQADGGWDQAQAARSHTRHRPAHPKCGTARRPPLCTPRGGSRCWRWRPRGLAALRAATPATHPAAAALHQVNDVTCETHASAKLLMTLLRWRTHRPTTTPANKLAIAAACARLSTGGGAISRTQRLPPPVKWRGRQVQTRCAKERPALAAVTS